MIQKENSFGTFDQEINTFFKDAHHFACLINTCLYQGQEIVKPKDLMLVDPKIQAYTRDVLMLLSWYRKSTDRELSHAVSYPAV